MRPSNSSPGSAQKATPPRPRAEDDIAKFAKTYRELLRILFFQLDGASRSPSLTVDCAKDYQRLKESTKIRSGETPVPSTPESSSARDPTSKEVTAAGLGPEAVGLRPLSDASDAITPPTPPTPTPPTPPTPPPTREPALAISKTAPPEPRTTYPDANRFGLTNVPLQGVVVKDAAAFDRILKVFEGLEALYGVAVVPPKVGTGTSIWARHTDSRDIAIRAASLHFYDFVEALRRDKQITTTLDINRYTMGVGEKLSQLLFNEQGRIVADTFSDRYNDEFHEHSNPTQARSDLRVRPISFRIMTQGSKVLYKSYVVPDSVPQDVGNNG